MLTTMQNVCFNTVDAAGNVVQTCESVRCSRAGFRISFAVRHTD